MDSKCNGGAFIGRRKPLSRETKEQPRVKGDGGWWATSTISGSGAQYEHQASEEAKRLQRVHGSAQAFFLDSDLQKCDTINNCC